MTSYWSDKFSEFSYREYRAIGDEYFDGDPPDVPLTRILALDNEDLKSFSQDLLNSGDLSPELTKLGRGLRAYLQFQDILGISVQRRDIRQSLCQPNVPLVNNRHYCYYESIIYLRESVVCWLDRNVLAALTLLRPFLELSVLHLYWYLHCEERKKSYRPYYDWLRDKEAKRDFGGTVNDVFEMISAEGYVEDKRLERLKCNIKELYKDLCTYNHTPKVHDIAVSGGGPGNVSFRSFLYALNITNALLRHIVELFILAYPMSLFLVDRYNKWGFGGPVGLFFDRCNFAILETYIGSENITALKPPLESIPKAKSLIEWFDKSPLPSHDEIEIEWQSFRQDSQIQVNADQFAERVAIFKAHCRRLSWITNYVKNLDGSYDS